MTVTVQTATGKSYQQQDGRFSVVEIITLSNGRVEQQVFLAQAGEDLAAHLTQTGANLLLVLAQLEISSNLSDVQNNGSLAQPTFVYSTVAQNAAAVRAAYLVATQTGAAMIGDFVNTLTNVQIASAFGITTGQAGTLRTNVLVPAAALAAQIRAAVGQ